MGASVYSALSHPAWSTRERITSSCSMTSRLSRVSSVLRSARRLKARQLSPAAGLDRSGTRVTRSVVVQDPFLVHPERPEALP